MKLVSSTQDPLEHRPYLQEFLRKLESSTPESRELMVWILRILRPSIDSSSEKADFTSHELRWCVAFRYGKVFMQSHICDELTVLREFGFVAQIDTLFRCTPLGIQFIDLFPQIQAYYKKFQEIPLEESGEPMPRGTTKPHYRHLRVIT